MTWRGFVKYYNSLFIEKVVKFKLIKYFISINYNSLYFDQN